MNTHCCCNPPNNSVACGCCEGIEALTPLPTANRPGLTALSYRIGTHATFLETLKARLSSSDYSKLAALSTRETDDFSLAIMDAWSVIADVLTFYQERIINEGFLRTATERRSVLELGRLVGYQPRPGVASSVYLAYTLDDNFKEETIIAKGARSQSIPGPGELSQSFETSEDLKARSQWNNLKPRTLQPQEIKFDQSLRINKIYLKGRAINLKPNDPLLLVYGDKAGEKILRRITALNIDFENDRTEALLQEVPFLIYLFVDLLRLMIDKVDQVLKVSSQEADETYVPLLNEIRLILRFILDNQSLGLYPPIYEAFFNHEHIFKFFSELPKWDSDNFYNNISPALKLKLETLVKSISPNVRGTNFWTNFFASELAQKIFKAVLNSPSKYRQNIICLIRYIFQQLLTNDLKERKILGMVARIVIPALDNYYKQLKENFNKVFNEVLNALTLLLNDEELHTDFLLFVETLLKSISLINDENNDVVESTLDNIKSWLQQISIKDNESITCGASSRKTTTLDELISPLSPLIKPPAIQVKNSLHLSPDISKLLSENSSAVPELLTNFQPLLKPLLYQAMANATLVDPKDNENNEQSDPPKLVSIHALRLSVPLFGNNAATRMSLKLNEDDKTKGEIKFISVPGDDWIPNEEEDKARLFLDNAYDEVKQGAHIIINNHSAGAISVATVASVTIRPRTAYSISGKTTQIELSKEWWPALDKEKSGIEDIRKTMVYVETERLELSAMPDITAVSGQVVDLQAFYGGLPSGRWVIVSGELLELPGDTPGVKKAELAMLSAVQHVSNETLPDGDKTHTRITFDKPLVNNFKRESVTIYGNVVKASHGETRKEVLGSGEGAKAFQSFTLKQPPLTFVPASSPSGVDSTLKIYVNDIQWHETNSLSELSASDQQFITRTDDDGKTTVVFGNGREGARLPTGIENIKAEYRNGIGKAGNIKAEQISLLTTRPLGVKEVINPLWASGGADKETRDQVRRHVPLAVKALDRLVSVQDYEDFSRIYAGIGKATAVKVSDGLRQIVHVTIAGANDIPIDYSSDLYRNLRQALLEFGDPYQAIQLEIRELILLVISASIRILPDYQWESVVRMVRVALLEVFSFDRRELGQDVMLSEVISVIQAVHGVAYVDVDILRGIPEKTVDAQNPGKRRLLTPAEIAEKASGSLTSSYGQLLTDNNGQPLKDPLARIVANLADIQSGAIFPAQLAFLTPEVPETLILNRIS